MSSIFYKKQCKLMLLSVLLFSFYTLPSFADENKEIDKKITTTEEDDDNDIKPFKFNFDLDLGRFIWKGIALSQGQVLTPSASFEMVNVELSSNAYLFLNNEPFSGSLNFDQAQYKVPEVDVSLGYKNLLLGDLSIKPSTELYVYPLGSDPLTGVVNLELSYPLWMVNVVSNSSVIYMGFAGVSYGDIGFSYENTFFDNFTLSSAVKLDITSNEFNKRFLSIDKTSLSAVETELSVAYNFNNFYIKPHIEFSSIIDPDLRKTPTFPNRPINSNTPNTTTLAKNNATSGTNTRGNNSNFMRRLSEFYIVNFGISVGYDY